MSQRQARGRRRSIGAQMDGGERVFWLEPSCWMHQVPRGAEASKPSACTGANGPSGRGSLPWVALLLARARRGYAPDARHSSSSGDPEKGSLEEARKSLAGGDGHKRGASLDQRSSSGARPASLLGAGGRGEAGDARPRALEHLLQEQEQHLIDHVLGSRSAAAAAPAAAVPGTVEGVARHVSALDVAHQRIMSQLHEQREKQRSKSGVGSGQAQEQAGARSAGEEEGGAAAAERSSGGRASSAGTRTSAGLSPVAAVREKAASISRPWHHDAPDKVRPRRALFPPRMPSLGADMHLPSRAVPRFVRCPARGAGRAPRRARAGRVGHRLSRCVRFVFCALDFLLASSGCALSAEKRRLDSAARRSVRCLPVLCGAGEWRGLPVAVKTVLYEATDESEHARAVMETAIAASVGHRNVVSARGEGGLDQAAGTHGLEGVEEGPPPRGSSSTSCRCGTTVLGAAAAAAAAGGHVPLRHQTRGRPQQRRAGRGRDCRCRGAARRLASYRAGCSLAVHTTSRKRRAFGALLRALCCGTATR